MGKKCRLCELAHPVIGITERGDAGRDQSWAPQVEAGEVDLAILITKCISQAMIDNVIRLHDAGKRFIVHCGCTGWGGTNIEPGSPAAIVQLRSLLMLLKAGFPVDHCVLRIDPIIPLPDGLYRSGAVLRLADRLIGLENLRVRISVMDDYAHVKKRFIDAGLQPVYPERQFYATPDQFHEVQRLCEEFPKVTFETCAEKSLFGPNIKAQGCVSDQDLAIVGIKRVSDAGINPQNRSGCLCLSGKKELLTQKHPCASRCLYCYWQDPAGDKGREAR